MTVSYQYEVASSTSGGFTRLLFMWRGSLWKLLYRELLFFIVAFGVLSALYRHAFTPDQKRLFEKLVVYCDTFINQMPLPFVLGFYVAYVAGRWWNQYLAIPWPDKTMHSLALYVGGNDEHSRILRRSLMRYLNLSLVLVLRSISSAVKRRFPTMEHIVEAGFMTPLELELFCAVPSVEFNTYWIPCTWFISLLKDAKANKAITDSQGLNLIMKEFNDFRSKCGLLWSYDWISIPLVYTQVVTLATYSYFLGALIGRQYTEANNTTRKQPQIEIDVYFPVYTIMQFFFFMGLLKVAEQLINPFGDDDEDFELNWLIDRHTKVSYLGVDTLMVKTPPITKDKYFDEVNLTLPYTGAAVAYKKKTYRGSVHNMSVPEDQMSMFLPEIIEEEEEPSSQKNTPKNSFPNLFTTQISPSAGIWRQSVAGSDGIRTPNVEEGLSPGPNPLETKLNSIYTFAKKPTTLSPATNSDSVNVTSVIEMQRWSSNSTVDSYCSTNGIMYASFENLPTTVSHPHPSPPTAHRQSPGRTTSGRRPSGVTAAQWKGVRWKPVLDDSWSDLPPRKRLSSSNSAICSSCSSTNKQINSKTDDSEDEESPPLLPSRRNTSPTPQLQTSKTLVKSTSSLPNLIGDVKDPTSAEKGFL